MKKSLFLTMCIATMLSSVHAGTVKVYAAASLNNAVTEISRTYQAQHPQTKIISVFGASSTLAKQIEAGASSDLYFSADQDWMNYLVQKKLINSSSVHPILLNQLVAISPKHLTIHFKPQSNFDFAQSFKGYVCTGQMESVPAGKYAKQSLTKLNWLNGLKGRIVGTDDVRSTLAFVERGECKVGIVYKTDALISRKVKIIGTFPADSHHPIIYPIALTKQGEKNADAIQFEQFIQKSTQAKVIFQKYGFRLNP
ncbi:molybdate ABC transporter substrate-binding protein [Acinetobacter variabilis]|uniref:Molybdate ABC transporter, periplasmic molybdate-binding protein n=1 Tax=Acinetobacter variabilis TaxID=70346 RepID=N9P5Z1_9GAMM|nr:MULTISPECIES: molybdate ABC transporter substrate-binding protein [Acinetobacter]AUX91231.1 molybdate ABC transporter substrate-binding protein [Acinetobacter sp. ACNIH1]ENX09565.1 molybdate ABC transporter, periplasmic molybdate-binding protein [Acinetobacter variabilis]MCU4312486.1 molybdate ABC transporter substrate-binding protein [Acinetobacter variabilis]MCU4366065.1 molybdate ABC transporter substrate-binding protein [Acinetobacter variabilis]MCU4376070.1 molybdate ABC transporter su